MLCKKTVIVRHWLYQLLLEAQYELLEGRVGFGLRVSALGS